MNGDNNILSWTGNLISVGAIATSIMGYAPAVAAIVALIWYAIQIYESQTVRQWIADRRARQLARLKARVVLLEARPRPKD